MKVSSRALIPILIVVAACAPRVWAGEPQAVEFSAVALNDSVPPRPRGDTIDVRSDTRNIRALTVRYTRGVLGQIPRLEKRTRAISFVLVTGPSSDEQITGHLTLPAGDRRQQVRMTSEEVDGLKATFRAGRTPQLRLSGLPEETHRVELLTVGRGRNLLRKVGRCVRHLRRDTNVIDVDFEDGSRRKTNRNRVSCGYDF